MAWLIQSEHVFKDRTAYFTGFASGMNVQSAFQVTDNKAQAFRFPDLEAAKKVYAFDVIPAHYTIEEA